MITMRPAVVLLASTLAAGASSPGQSSQASQTSAPGTASGQAAPAAPAFVDPATVRPKARPDDVGSIGAIVAALYDVISGPAGPRDWDRFKSLLLPECRLTPVVHRPDGPDVYRSLDADAYIARAGATFSKEAFFETGVSNQVEEFGNVAHVFSTYESRHARTETPFARGINSIQLLKLGPRWWIASIAWDSERPGVPIPPRYLSQ